MSLIFYYLNKNLIFIFLKKFSKKLNFILMNFNLNKTVLNLPPSGIRKFFDLVLAAGPEVVSLGVGEPDFSTPWNIREAAIFALQPSSIRH